MNITYAMKHPDIYFYSSVPFNDRNAFSVSIENRKNGTHTKFMSLMYISRMP